MERQAPGLEALAASCDHPTFARVSADLAGATTSTSTRCSSWV
ncbi:hypothetical protein [Streptomyces albidochromogenes]|uniref:Uncharacterized protein n=1 Tax=Streptomyces albidochromogenes TaxID=329524 RepID=A0ABW6FUG0_9ACTN